MKQALKPVSPNQQVAANVRESTELWNLMEGLLLDMLEGGSMVPWEGRIRDLLDAETVAYWQRPDRSESEGLDD